MKHLITAAWLGAAVIAGTPAISHLRPATSELAILRTLDSGQLGQLRAGAVETRPALRGDERTTLAQAQRDNPSLTALRAGDVSNSTLITIALVLAIVVLIVILV